MLINLAHAADAAAPAGGPEGFMGFLPLIAIFVLFYFMLIRPQMKKAKEQKNMLDALQKGDEVVTQGGMVGKVVKISDNFVSLEVAENTVIMVQKPTVQILLPKGTIKENQ
jgi:preprotein translocase subunit YajC